MQQAERIGLVNLVAVAPRLDMKFVESAFGHSRDERFPDAGVTTRREQVRLWMPVVEAADHRNLPRIRRPDAEDCAVDSVAGNEVRAQRLVEAIVAALIEQVEVLIREEAHSVRRGGDRRVRHSARF